MCSSRAAAALHATTDVDIVADSIPQHVWPDFQRWLELCTGSGNLQHLTCSGMYLRDSQQYISLRLSVSSLQKLVSLQLTSVQVDVVPCAGAAGGSTSGPITAHSTAPTSSTTTIFSSSGISSAGGQPQLQQLELTKCGLSVSSFQQLCKVTGLTSLRMQDLHFTGAQHSHRPVLPQSHLYWRWQSLCLVSPSDSKIGRHCAACWVIHPACWPCPCMGA